jgi:hypothetical protein
MPLAQAQLTEASDGSPGVKLNPTADLTMLIPYLLLCFRA